MQEPAHPNGARFSCRIVGRLTDRCRESPTQPPSHQAHLYGIRGRFIQWITIFLESMSQQVLVEGQSPTSAPFTSGAPQETVLGPSSFLFYTNDLPSHVSSTCRLFADDSLLYRIIKSPEDHIKLEEVLEQLYQWERDWLVTFNPTKCKVIRFTKKRRSIHRNYTIHGHTLKIVKT